MTYEKIVAMMQTYYANADTTKFSGHYAVQVNVIGEGEGAFYIEIADGKVNVQPYDYIDRNACLNVTVDTLKAIVNGNMNYSRAIQENHMAVEGDSQVVSVLDSICMRKADTVETVTYQQKNAPVHENNKSTTRKSHVRKRAIKKLTCKTKNSKKAK